MAAELPGKDISLWVDTSEKTNYQSLPEGDSSCDVVVIGGGMTGLMTAWFLQSEGVDTILIEKRRLAAWTTGYTTAKLTSQHYLVYKHLIDEQGEAVARAYARANEDAIAKIAEIADQMGVDCDFERREAFVYTNDEKTVSDIRDEVDAARKVGLPASLETTTELPFEVKAAIKFANQAQFHPRKFLLAIAKDLEKKKVPIYEKSGATDIKTGTVNAVATNHGIIKARHVVEATQFPFWRPEIFKDAMWTKNSYALGVTLKPGSKYPKGMYITTDEPMRTIRSHPYKGGEILIFGGESHKDVGKEEADERHRNLIADVQKKFDVEEIVYRWFAGDAMPYDRMPYIGEYPDAPGIYTATGYRAWGLAWATAAAQIFRDRILGKSVDWAEPFGLGRLNRK